MAMKPLAYKDKPEAATPMPAGGKTAEPRYPYGTELHLDHETLQNMGIKDLPKAGDAMHLAAKGKVSRVSQEDTPDGGKRRSMSVQLTHAEMVQPPKDKAKALYGGE